jgi:hypothetical protein
MSKYVAVDFFIRRNSYDCSERRSHIHYSREFAVPAGLDVAAVEDDGYARIGIVGTSVLSIEACNPIVVRSQRYDESRLTLVGKHVQPSACEFVTHGITSCEFRDSVGMGYSTNPEERRLN